MILFDFLSLILTGMGVIFFIAGTAGLLRFPDVYTRLHALTKADSLGLGMVILGLSLKAGSVDLLLKLFLIWVVVLFSSATCCYLIALAGWRMNIKYWKK